ncbi:MAG TPA: endonuclease MutS2 [Nitrospira sp.]|nr:endonuclease MutS2 [Nitrospira sp.]
MAMNLRNGLRGGILCLASPMAGSLESSPHSVTGLGHEVIVKLFEQTTQVLEWGKLLEVLASHGRSTMGAARCRAAVLPTDLVEAQRRQEETVEVARLQETADPPPSLSFPDIREPLARAAKGAALDAHELRDHALVLALWDEVQRYLSRHAQEAPTVAAAAEVLRSGRELKELSRALDGAIHPDGSIKESATPELRRFTHHANDLKQQIRHQLDQILQSRRFAELLQEQYFAQREGRYVVPIKTEMQGRVPGIVHDVSSSGATVFVEPRELVELNNAIKVADLEIDREIRRILRELSSLVAEKSDLILAGLDVLAELDCIAARAAFGRQLRAHPVGLNDHGRVRLKQARHPLLVLSKAQVVANDILLEDHVQVLVISGPNTGGKTVTLKIVGLFALMVRAGLLLPCEPESEMAIFQDIYADIGDAQDLARDLSSFSAHMTQMIHLLKDAHRARQALVLLDEPVTSTDPIEGAALAEALLCRLASLGMKVIATTHYRSLKALAQTTAGFTNASVEFNVATLSPTYCLFMGVPGGSSAIEIAGRLGMDRGLLDEARQKLEQDDRVLERMLDDLHGKQRQLTEDLARAVAARAEAEEAAQLAKDQLARLEATEREERKGIKKKLQEQFSRARAEVQATVEEVKREQKLIKAKEAKQRLVELEAQTRAEFTPSGTPIPLEQLGAGDQVEIGRLGMTGTLLEAPQGKKRVRVKVGEGELLATVANLIGLARGTTSLPAAVQSAPSKPLGSTRPYHAEEQTVVDVRGKAADDALDEVVAALDRATLEATPALRIIHGHGTGKLKAALREYLKSSPYVASARPGDRAEGGDGVTIVTVR